MMVIPPWDYRDPFVRIHDDLVLISCLRINMAFQRYQREFLEDFLTQHHADRHIVVRAFDGEDLVGLGFLRFFQDLCQVLGIESHRITVISSSQCSGPWNWRPAPAVLFWGADQHIQSPEPLEPQARLLGITLGRFSPFRHRILERLDQEFGTDIFMSCNYTQQEALEFYESVAPNAQQQVSWMHRREFDRDPDLPEYLVGNGTIPWPQACASYSKLSANFSVEIVVETDLFNPDWFTEKTSRCLFTGKPFLLLAGTGSLQRLRDQGFQTFHGIIDESYDQALTFHERLDGVCQQLHCIRNHPDRAGLLSELQQRAGENRRNWNAIKSRIHGNDH